MKIDVLLFATLRERFQRPKVPMEVPDGTPVGSVLRLLFGDEEEASKMARGILFAVNRNYVSSDRVLQEGDEVALIPPVAGG